VKSTVQDARAKLESAVEAYAYARVGDQWNDVDIDNAAKCMAAAIDAFERAVREEAVAPWREAAKVAQRQDTTDRAREERKDRLIEELRAENEQLKARGGR